MAASTKTLTLRLVERTLLANVIQSLPTPGTMHEVMVASKLVTRFWPSDQEIEEHGIQREGQQLRWNPAEDYDTNFDLDERSWLFLVRLLDAGVWPYSFPDVIESLYDKITALK